MIRSWLLAAVVVFAGCGADMPEEGETRLRVSVLPEQSPDVLRANVLPLIEFLEAQTGYSLQLQLYDTYEALSAAFAAGELDLAWFGGLTYVIAERANGAQPLVMRDVDSQFTTACIVGQTTPGESMQDFAGKRFAFGPRLSTSGHLMPRFFMEQRGIDPEAFFATLEHTAGHDATAYRVRDGEVDVGCMNRIVLQAMLADGRLGPADVRVLEISPTYSDYVWAVSATMASPVAISLRDAFLALDPADPKHARILSLRGGNGYYPASPADFDELREAATADGLLESGR